MEYVKGTKVGKYLILGLVINPHGVRVVSILNPRNGVIYGVLESNLSYYK